MNQNLSVEEVVQRIRARVTERDASVPPANGDARHAPLEEQTAAAGHGADHSSLPEIQANDLSPLRSEIDIALEGTRRVGQINPRNPGLHNAAIQFLKKIMRRSLAWYTRPLHYFQGGVIRALQQIEGVLQSHENSLQNHQESLQSVPAELSRLAGLFAQNEAEILRQRAALSAEISRQRTGISNEIDALQKRITGVALGAVSHEDVRALEEQISGVRTSVLELSQTAADIEAKLLQMHSAQGERFEQMLTSHSERMLASQSEQMRTSYGERIAGIDETLRHVQLQGRLRDRDLRRFFHDVRTSMIAPAVRENSAPVSPMFPAGIKRESNFDYFAFEDLYRGDETMIRRRQKEYLEYFRGRDNVLDVGCGRGEFLELLREQNISARGVELGTGQYLLCQEKGLDVVQQDLFSYLESIPDNSLGGLFSAQVIEHLTASDQLRYVALAQQKTSPGSPVIFETINAQCVWAVMRNFFLDPTHVRPVHPETLKFAMESVNFKNVELRFSSPMSDRQIPPLQLEGDARNLPEFNRRLQDLNELLYGDQDYAAIGWR
jgi:SAM-dependent methyltransferase